ncbi:hypothetical protein GDO81_024729 [Engystomops pustulosus]|uniref:Zinc finger RING-type eukaryotic domain-containing protein n=1 Tax=Engystomops pustulosus TaxID=76066 RepID=A0AAV6Z1D6_ENGPU|nr:hypothetical protein GDO81_024729 [Engystomops pustulosus]
MFLQRNNSRNFPPTNLTETPKSRHSRFHSDLSCPVCLQTATSPVETNCGHLFCGESAAPTIIKPLYSHCHRSLNWAERQ